MIKEKESIPKSFDLGQAKPKSDESEEPENKRQKLEITESETTEKGETPKLQAETETETENHEIEEPAPVEQVKVEEVKKQSSLLLLNDDAMSSCTNS